ncbi:MAG: acetyl-CoA carboxylase biotin carboxyl carrier protein [Thalassospira sp.]|jgi:acetyl-CoA carboxylase biotin carboxyl carrier protein|nr:acetyl-CoA carboxylase biotin carboxyl carrier protein [Thalassospira sp.]
MSTKEKPAAAHPSVDDKLVKHLARLLDDTGLTEIEVADGSFRIRVARQSGSVVHTAAIAPTVQAASAAAPVKAANSDAITSPMVGNTYLSPRPGAAAFITVGARVEKGQTLLIIEAMKVMNPIPSPRAGVVKEILVTDGQPVEFGEALVVVE